MAEQLGTLVIVVLKAKDLPDKHTFSKQDPFAQVSLSGKTLRTSVDIKGGQHPVWDEEIRMKVMKADGAKNRTLEVSCWAKEPRDDDLLGKGTLDISETLRTGEFDDWIQLENNGTQRGSLYLEMTFFAAGPAPASLSRRPSKMKPSERLSRPPQPMQTISEGPSKTPPKTSPQSVGGYLAPHTPPKSSTSGRPGYSPPTVNGRLAPPQTLTPGPRNSPPRQYTSPLSTPPKEALVPPLLRPGNMNSPPKPLAQANPLPPNDPMHPILPDPWASSTAVPSRSSPPVSASAYPPSEGALGLLPLPASLQPAGAASRPAGSGSPAPSGFQVGSTPWRHPGGTGPPHPQSPDPSQFQVGSTPWRHPGGTGPPHPQSPNASEFQVGSTPWNHPGGTGPPHPQSPDPTQFQVGSTPWNHPGGTGPPHPQSPDPSQFHVGSTPWNHPGGVGPPQPAPSHVRQGSGSSFPVAHTPTPDGAGPNRYRSPSFPDHNTSIGPPPGVGPDYGARASPFRVNSDDRTPVPGAYPNAGPGYQSPPSFPVAMPSASLSQPYDYGSPAPARAFSPPYPPNPQPQGSYAQGPPRTQVPQAIPSAARTRPNFPDESGVSTPKAELQPWHQPSQPSSHLRNDAGGASASSSKPAARPVNRDEELAKEIERMEREEEQRRREDEERDMALARELDRTLNA